MNTSNFTPLEEALRQLHGGVLALMRMGTGMQDREDGAAVDFVADKMLKDVEAAQEWFEAAHTEARLNGPCAVS